VPKHISFRKADLNLMFKRKIIDPLRYIIDI
jgi:hypothetical protein